MPAPNAPKLINHWTPVHLLSGFVMQKKGLTVGQTLAASIVFEMLENTVGVQMKLKVPEGANNMAMDTVFNMAGYFLGRRI